MFIRLNWEALEATLPDVTRTARSAMASAHMGGQPPLHESTDFAGIRRRHHGMKVIGHQAKRKDPDVKPFLCLP
jgi:hypothetical protein